MKIHRRKEVFKICIKYNHRKKNKIIVEKSEALKIIGMSKYAKRIKMSK